MSAKTYKIRALVLKKTRLGEKDLIVTLLDEGGALVRGVAKGARKPGGSLAARLELFSTVNALMAQGRSLDVVCEARLAGPLAATPAALEQAACAAPVAELLCLVAQPDLVQPRLFAISDAAMACIAQSGPEEGLSVCAASLWKIMAQSGFRPSFAACVACGGPVRCESGSDLVLSLADGGVVCPACARPADALVVSGDTLRWCDALIRSRFEEVIGFGMRAQASYDALHLARQWVRAHTGRNLKSLDFLFASGLF